jgi:hypothetical protein
MIRELLKKLGVPWRDEACLYGRFGVTVYEVKGEQKRVLRRIQKKNQIVNDGREAMLQLLGFLGVPGVPQIQNQIWSLSAGTGGIPPTITDFQLVAPVWTGVFVPPLEVSVVAIPPSQFEIQTTKMLPTTDANGLTLQEAAIFTRGDNDDPGIAGNRRMYCRQTHPPILKLNTIQIVYDWRLGITVEGAP